MVDYTKEQFQNKIQPTVLTMPKAKKGERRISFTFFNPNPDDLLVFKGKSVKIYQDMARESNVKAALFQKKNRLMGWDWRIAPGAEIGKDPTEQDIERAQLLEHNLRNLAGTSVSQVLWEMLDALNNGYSILEKVMFATADGLWMYKQFLHKDPYFYKFKQDSFGNVTGVVADNVHSLEHGTTFPPEFFVIYSFMSLYNNPYGSSDLRAAYRPFWIKDTIWKFWTLAMEKFGMPTLVGKVPPGTQDTVIDELLKMMKQVQTEFNVVLPQEQLIEVLDITKAKMSDRQSFDAAMDRLDREIIVGILGASLTVDSGARGARSLGEVHERILDDAVEQIAKQVSDAITEQIVFPWMNMNFPAGSAMPKFVFDRPITIKDPKNDVEAVQLASQMVPVAQSYIYDRYDIPRPKQGEILIDAPVQPAPQSSDHTPDDEQMIELRHDCWKALRPLYQQIASQVFSKVRDSKILEKQDIVKARDMGIPVNVGNVRDFYTDMLLYGRLLGRGAKVKLEKNRDQMLIDAGMDSSQFSEVIREYDAEAHRLAGVLKDRLTRAIRRAIVSAVAEKQSEHALWAMLGECVDKVGIDDFDAPDIQCLEIGYFEGRKER